MTEVPYSYKGGNNAAIGKKQENIHARKLKKKSNNLGNIPGADGASPGWGKKGSLKFPTEGLVAAGRKERITTKNWRANSEGI